MTVFFKILLIFSKFLAAFIAYWCVFLALNARKRLDIGGVIFYCTMILVFIMCLLR